MPTKTVRVKEVRSASSPTGGGGICRQVKVSDVEESALTPEMEVVPSDTPLHDWEVE